MQLLWVRMNFNSLAVKKGKDLGQLLPLGGWLTFTHLQPMSLLMDPNITSEPLWQMVNHVLLPVHKKAFQNTVDFSKWNIIARIFWNLVL